MKNILNIEYIPESINEYIDNFRIKRITKAQTSGDSVYQIGNKYILKISENVERLKREKMANDFLFEKLPVSKTICYVEENCKAYYLKTQLQGDTLINDKYLANPKKLAKLLAKAMKMVHSVDVSDCNIKSLDSEGECFIHGDFCLPNILTNNDEIVGFIDTEASGKGDPWMDYAWCIWSFEHNLGTSQYTKILLKELEIEFNNEKYDLYTQV